VEIFSSSHDRFLFWGDRLLSAPHEPSRNVERFISQGFVPGEAVSVIYENLNSAKDFRADPVAIRLQKRGGRTFHFYSTVEVNGVNQRKQLNPLEYWTGTSVC